MLKKSIKCVFGFGSYKFKFKFHRTIKLNYKTNSKINSYFLLTVKQFIFNAYTIRFNYLAKTKNIV